MLIPSIFFFIFCFQYHPDSAPIGVIEATQAYGLEEPSVEEVKEAEIIVKAATADKGRGFKVNETPAPRSRRAKRMKEAEVEQVSVLETPLNKVFKLICLILGPMNSLY